MARLTIIEGPGAGRQFLLKEGCQVIGRVAEADIPLPSQAVSRRHARILGRDDEYVLEDLGGVNGTFVNGQRLENGRTLADGDELTICEYRLAYWHEPAADEGRRTTREEIVAASNAALFAERPEQKLQAVLMLAQQLGQALEVGPLLDRLLHNLLQLFPRADRGLVVLCEQERLVVPAQKTRRGGDSDFSYSRTVIRKALQDGRGILSDDVHADRQFEATGSIAALEATSLMCVPLIGHDGHALGAIQLDCMRPGKAFDGEDLRLLTTVSLMAAVVLENVALNAVRVREEGLRRDLALGREIQLGFLPAGAPPPRKRL